MWSRRTELWSRAIRDVATDEKGVESIAQTVLRLDSTPFLHAIDDAIRRLQRLRDMCTRGASSSTRDAPNQRAEPENYECVVCLDASRTIVFVPCGHMCICEKCSESHVFENCPVCRKESFFRMKVFGT